MIPRLPLVCLAVIAAAFALAWMRERLPREAPEPELRAPEPEPEFLQVDICNREGHRTAIVFGRTWDVVLTGILFTLEVEGHLLLQATRQRQERTP